MEEFIQQFEDLARLTPEQFSIYILENKGKIKALSLDEVRKQKEQLFTEGWERTYTISKEWIEFLHNDCLDVNKEVKSLSVRKKPFKGSDIEKAILAMEEEKLQKS
jgi:hypothetical protein